MLRKEPLDLDRYKERMRPKTFISLFRSQIAAFLATACDFAIVILLTELLGLWYVASNAIGAFCGAVVSFVLGRFWVFVSLKNKIGDQVVRYLLVSAGSLILNTGGVYLVTEYFGINYVLSKVIVSLFVGLAWNFTLHKYFVFR
ncbi:MAG: GtrA family protein [Bacteroidota bacterium]